MLHEKNIGRYVRRIVCILLLYGVLFLLVFFSGELSSGVREGIRTSIDLLIPSLFVFLIASNLLMRSKAGELVARPFGFLSRFFRIPLQNVLIVVLSLLGGYPVGAKLLGDAVRQKRLSPDEASRMLCYCVNCGPAFLITGVGGAVFGEIKLGFLLYLSQIIACLIVGRANAHGIPRQNSGKHTPYPASGSSGAAECFVGSVTDAIRSMAVICGFVVAFSAFLPFFSLLAEQVNPTFACLLRGVLEVTTGCSQLANPNIPNRLLFAAGFTAFGGICVLLQVAAMLSGTGVRLLRFLKYRLLYTAVSVLSVWGMLQFLPDTAQSLSVNRELPKRLYSVSPAAAFFLILLSVMLLFFRQKGGKIEKTRR